MAAKKTLIADYLKHRFFERYDVKGHDLSAIALRKLKNNLSEEEFKPYQQLDTATNGIIELISEDEDRDGTESDKKQIDYYEQLADNKNLPRAVRIKMYDLVLIGHEKYIEGNTLYLNVIDKKISLLNKNHISDLKHAAILIKQHSFGVLYSLKHRLLSAVKHKLSDNDYPDRQEGIELKKQSAEEKKQQRIAAARQEITAIDEKLKESLAPEDRAELLQQRLESIKRCGFGRLRTCREKADIYEELGYLSAVKQDFEAVDFYANEAAHQEDVANNILKHLHIREKGRGL